MAPFEDFSPLKKHARRPRTSIANMPLEMLQRRSEHSQSPERAGETSAGKAGRTTTLNSEGREPTEQSIVGDLPMQSRNLEIMGKVGPDAIGGRRITNKSLQNNTGISEPVLTVGKQVAAPRPATSANLYRTQEASSLEGSNSVENSSSSPKTRNKRFREHETNNSSETMQVMMPISVQGP